LIESVHFNDLNPSDGHAVYEMYTIDFLSKPIFSAGTPVWLVLTGDKGVVAWGANGTDTDALYKTNYSTDLTTWDDGVVALQPGFEIVGEVSSNVPDSSSTILLLAGALVGLGWYSTIRQERNYRHADIPLEIRKRQPSVKF
jgi:hypothetical protein